MNTEERTRFEVLLERIDTNVKVIAEGHGALVERMDRMDVRFDRLEERFDRLELRVAVVETRLEALDSKVEALGSKVKTLDSRVKTLGSKVKTLDSKVEVFAADTGRRLERIETHLGLEKPPRPEKRSQRATTKRHKAN